MRAHFIGIVMALAGLPGIALAHPPAQLGSQADEGVIEEIHAFRKALAEAVRNKDAATLRGMYAEKFTHTHTSAKIDGRDARVVNGSPTPARVFPRTGPTFGTAPPLRAPCRRRLVMPY